MREHIVISVTAHVALLVVAYFGLPSLFDRAPPVDIPIPVEVVTIASETRVPVTRVEQPPESESKPEPQAQTLPQPPEERPAEPEVAALDPDAEPLEPAPKPKAAKPEAKPKVAPRPLAKPKPPAKTFDAGRIAALLDKSRKEETPPVPPEIERKPRKIEADQEPQKRVSRIASRSLSVSEIDFIKQQYYRCWSIPAGAEGAHEMLVTIRIFLNPDGSLQGVPQVIEAARMKRAGEEFFRTLAESALRAVHKCNPLRLPSDDYEKWQEIELTFNPREMLG